MTKRYEETVKTTLKNALRFYKENEPRGEYVLVVEGKSRAEIAEEQHKAWKELSLEEHMAHYEEAGVDHKEAMKLVAKDRGISRRAVYQMLLERKIQ